MAKHTCWIDGAECYAGDEALELETCRLCREIRLKYAVLEKGMNPFAGGAK